MIISRTFNENVEFFFTFKIKVTTVAKICGGGGACQCIVFGCSFCLVVDTECM